MDYSQGGEQKYITNYFRGLPAGRFLEIGAYNAEVFSNTRALVLLGWGGVMVEPAKGPLKGLREFYKDNENITLVDYGISNRDGVQTFYDHPGATASLDKGHADKWALPQSPDTEIRELEVHTVAHLVKEHPGPYRFINIDCEGLDYEILAQMDLNALGCDLLCVEYNGFDAQKYINHCQIYGLKLIFKNDANVICGR